VPEKGSGNHRADDSAIDNGRCGSSDNQDALGRVAALACQYRSAWDFPADAEATDQPKLAAVAGSEQLQPRDEVDLRVAVMESHVAPMS
jgi:hypothetical protein